MEIHPVGDEFFMRTDGQTDVTKLIVPFRNLANTPKRIGFLKTCSILQIIERLSFAFVWLLL